MPKKLKRGAPVLPGIVCYVEKKGKTFLVQFHGPTGTIQIFVKLLVELFWSLQMYRIKNTDEKP